MVNKIFCYLPALALFLTACDSHQVFDEYKTVPNQWHKDSVVSFTVTPPDSTKNYNLFINIRNNNNYKYSNLFLIAEVNFPYGKIIKDTLEYQMAAPDGTLLGSGFSDIKENKLWYKEGFKFDEIGPYTINVQQAMRKNGAVEGVELLEGITDVGVRIEPAMN